MHFERISESFGEVYDARMKFLERLAAQRAQQHNIYATEATTTDADEITTEQLGTHPELTEPETDTKEENIETTSKLSTVIVSTEESTTFETVSTTSKSSLYLSPNMILDAKSMILEKIRRRKLLLQNEKDSSKLPFAGPRSINFKTPTTFSTTTESATSVTTLSSVMTVATPNTSQSPEILSQERQKARRARKRGYTYSKASLPTKSTKITEISTITEKTLSPTGKITTTQLTTSTVGALFAARQALLAQLKMRNLQQTTLKPPEVYEKLKPETTFLTTVTVSVGSVLSAREQFLAKLQARKAITQTEIYTTALTQTPNFTPTTISRTTTTSITSSTTITTGANFSERQQFLVNLQEWKAITSSQPTNFNKELKQHSFKERTTVKPMTTRKHITFPTFSTIVVQNDEDDPVIKNLICKYSSFFLTRLKTLNLLRFTPI